MPSLTGKSNSLETNILKLILNAVAIANLADNAASGPLTNLYIALHTADPTTAGAQTANETSYGSYARIAIARSAGSPAWTVTGSGPAQAVNAAVVAFATCTSGSATITHFSIGTLASGAGIILYGGPLSAPLSVSNGVAPTFGAGALVISET